MDNTQETLFRGKYNGNWVVGDLTHKQFKGRTLTIIRVYDGFSNYDEFEVIPETVGEFVGIIGRNDTRVYEGDVIQIHDNVYVVSKKTGGFIATNINASEVDEDDAIIHLSQCNKYLNYQVIGNIHDDDNFVEVETFAKQIKETCLSKSSYFLVAKALIEAGYRKEK